MGALPMQAALATLVGTAGSWVYLKLLIDDMDNVSEGTVAPFRQAQAQLQGPARLVLQAFAAYRYVGPALPSWDV